MLSSQKNTLLYMLANFKAKFYEESENVSAMTEHDNRFIKAGEIIIRNLTSIEKQIKKL